jgi:DDE family transposase
LLRESRGFDLDQESEREITTASRSAMPVEHPFGTLKMRMGATHFLMKRLQKVATEMALHVLAYNLTRVMNIMGSQPLMAAIRA